MPSYDVRNVTAMWPSLAGFAELAELRLRVNVKKAQVIGGMASELSRTLLLPRSSPPSASVARSGASVYTHGPLPGNGKKILDETTYPRGDGKYVLTRESGTWRGM